MNINCTSKCLYQSDGKCTMEQIPDMSANSYHKAAIPTDSDCPYVMI